MTIVANALAKLAEDEELGEQVVERAKEILANIILPKKITGRVIEKYIR